MNVKQILESLGLDQHPRVALGRDPGAGYAMTENPATRAHRVDQARRCGRV